MNCIAPGPIETEGAFKRLDPTGTLCSRNFQNVKLRLDFVDI